MIHVFTLTWSGLDKLKRLRDGLEANLKKTGQDYIWYVRDNGSADGTPEVVQDWDKVTLLSMTHNRDNFAQGVNSLAELAKPHINPEDPILLLNNDVQFNDEDSLSKMLNLYESGCSVVGARLLYTDTNLLQHAGVIFSERYGNMPYHFRHKEKSDADACKNRLFQAVTAAVCFVRADDFVAVGGMDEKFSWAFEDIDMCLKIGAQGGKIAYCGETNIFHEESASLKKNPVNRLFLSPNVAHFKSKWNLKYDLDHTKYLSNKEYKLI